MKRKKREGLNSKTSILTAAVLYVCKTAGFNLFIHLFFFFVCLAASSFKLSFLFFHDITLL